MNGLLLAVSFLTVIPVRRGPAPPMPGDLGRAAGWFPLAGLALGATLCLSLFVAGRFEPLLAAALIVTLWAGLTGGLHLDGLADCCDGLLPPGLGAPERRLEIMHDPRLGVFGSIGLCLFLILKILATASLLSQLRITDYALRIASYELPITAYTLLLAPALARWLILPVATQPTAQPGGRGAEFSLGLSRSAFVAAAIIPVGLILCGGWTALGAAVVAHVVALGIVRLARARLGGVTGDVLGLTVEATELSVLLIYAAQTSRTVQPF